MTAMTARKRQRRRGAFWPFRFYMDDGKSMTVRAKVRYGKKPVDLILTDHDVERSIALNGVGDTRKCSMALCTMRHANDFVDHDVAGPVDWTYTRAAVVSKEKEGLPFEVTVYAHSSDVAKFQDSIDGQRRLLALLKEKGPMLIRLRPLKAKKAEEWKARLKRKAKVAKTAASAAHTAHTKKSKKPPTQSKRSSEHGKRLRGAHLRYATAFNGLSPDEQAKLRMPRKAKLGPGPDYVQQGD